MGQVELKLQQLFMNTSERMNECMCVCIYIYTYININVCTVSIQQEMIPVSMVVASGCRKKKNCCPKRPFFRDAGV